MPKLESSSLLLMRVPKSSSGFAATKVSCLQTPNLESTFNTVAFPYWKGVKSVRYSFPLGKRIETLVSPQIFQLLWMPQVNMKLGQEIKSSCVFLRKLCKCYLWKEDRMYFKRSSRALWGCQYRFALMCFIVNDFLCIVMETVNILPLLF